MRKILLLGVLIANNTFTDFGGSFAGGLTGGLFGAAVGNAISSPRRHNNRNTTRYYRDEETGELFYINHRGNRVYVEDEID